MKAITPPFAPEYTDSCDEDLDRAELGLRPLDRGRHGRAVGYVHGYGHAGDRAFCTGGDQKQSFNADTEHLAGLGAVAFSGLNAFLESDEAKEGVTAFAEKRQPDFGQYRAAVSR